MDERSCAGAIAADLAGLGVLPGDIILMHSSLKSLGHVPGGAETVISGLLEAIGPRGTLLLPALSWALKPPETYDPKLTPAAQIGIIPEYFRTREGTARSIHPTHSVCGTSGRAAELLDDHWRDRTPCGQHSPFHKIADLGGKLIMLGCGLRPNTTMHALEEYLEPPYLYGPGCVFTIRDWNGRTYQKEYRTHSFSGWAQRYDRVAELENTDFIRRGKVLAADTFLLHAADMRKAVLQKMKDDPLFFVDRIPT